MEALRDAVVTRKAPHSYDGLKPLAQCTPELSEQRRGIMQQLIDATLELTQRFDTARSRTSFEPQQSA